MDDAATTKTHLMFQHLVVLFASLVKKQGNGTNCHTVCMLDQKRIFCHQERDAKMILSVSAVGLKHIFLLQSSTLIIFYAVTLLQNSNMCFVFKNTYSILTKVKYIEIQ